MRARSTRLAGSVRERAIETSLAKSSSPIANSITPRHAVITFDSLPRIKSQGTRHHSADESRTNERFNGIGELAKGFAVDIPGPVGWVEPGEMSGIILLTLGQWGALMNSFYEHHKGSIRW